MMDSSIPESAGALLDLIASKEAPQGYGTIFGNNQDDLPKPLISMTLSEVIASGPFWTSKYGSSACGRYQFMTNTLKSLRTSEGLSGSEIFGPAFQDRLGYALLDRRGYERFLSGQLSVSGFGLGLAKEWASFPVLADIQGAHRFVHRGETYYAGDRLNKALISPEAVETALSAHPKPVAESTVADVFASTLSNRLAGSASVSDIVLQDLPGNVEGANDIGATRTLSVRNDGDGVRDAVKFVSDPDWLWDVQSTAARRLLAYDGEVYPRDGCAITLSVLLQKVDIDISDTYQALALGNLLKKRGWKTIQVGAQKDGDVGSTCGRVPNHGKDHIYLVLQSLNSDEMVVADNQQPQPHFRFASGQGRTPTKFFLRAPSA